MSFQRPSGKLNIIVFIFLLLPGPLVSCVSSEKQKISEVKNAGSMHQMMMSGDISGKLFLNQIKSQNLYGIGPLEKLKGEITVVNGKPYVSTVSLAGKPVVQKNWESSAVFFVYADSKEWVESEVNHPVESKRMLNKLIAEALDSYSIDHEKKVLFKIHANARSLKYHILNLDKQESNFHKSHRFSKKVYDIKSSPVEIVGFWSPQKMMGIFTHRGDRTHLHFISSDEKHSGHVDSLKLDSGAKIFISVKRRP